MPIFFYDSLLGAIGLVHAGWRGLKENIIYNAVHQMTSLFNTSPANIFCAVGPYIKKDNYEVDSDVADVFPGRFSVHGSNGKYLLDLGAVAISQLMDAGIPVNQCELAETCTYSEENFFHSYRRDGNAAGRNISMIGIIDK
ncbi:polyphenol oxidase family protein [candidate division KSB1 bacterium]